MSEKLQELICYMGQTEVFDQASQTLKHILGIEISDRQIGRVSEFYGEKIEQQMVEYDPEVLPKIKLKSNQEPVYVMVDGSMVYTREREWMEMKLGRIHARGQIIDNQKDRSSLDNSVYISHLGKCDAFFEKLERLLIPYPTKIIVADGAKWIWKWVEDNYPGSTQILDFFHAMDKLAIFSRHHFIKDKIKRKQWLHIKKEQLLDNGVYQVIQEIRSIKARGEIAQKAKQDVIRYFEQHEDRMQYKTYKEKGFMIGSGPIESAQKSVIQQRLKLSGQRWSINGAQYISNLRCAYKSKNEKCIRYLIKNAA